jgi:soluble lytic murein transglycosylase-like protein
MNIKNLIFSIAFFVLIISLFSYKEEKKEGKKEEVDKVRLSKLSVQSPPVCLKMYDAIMKYADMYNIPKSFAFGIAYAETRYNGPFHWKYKHTQTSCAGAIGPMQIMPSTGRLIWKDSTFTNQELMTDIDFNVRTSMKLLRKLHDKHGDWKIVFGCYNTGRPMINDYAIRVYNFKPNWEVN